MSAHAAESIPETAARKSRRPRIVAVVATALALGAAGVGIFAREHHRGELQQWTDAQAVPSVELIAPSRGKDGGELTLPGDIRAYIDAPIYARVSGYVKHWDVDIGAHVKAGQPLAEIETPEIDEQLNQARADLRTTQAKARLAQVSAKRWHNLLASDSVSKQDADEKAGDAEAREAGVAAAQANVDRLAALESFKRIVAPFDGIVTARRVDIGDLVDAGSGNRPELFRIADTSKLRIYVSVPQSYAAQMQRGLAAQLSVPDEPGKTYPARIVDTADAIDPGSRTLLVQLQTPNADNALLAGSYTDVHFDLPSAVPALRVPISALVFRADGMQVATLDAKNRVVMKAVKIGRDFGTEAEILAGLDANDSIINSPPDSLADGDAVQVANAAHAIAQAPPGKEHAA